MGHQALSLISIVACLAVVSVAIGGFVTQRIRPWTVNLALGIAFIPFAFLQQGWIRWFALGVAVANLAATPWARRRDRRRLAAAPRTEEHL